MFALFTKAKTAYRACIFALACVFFNVGCHGTYNKFLHPVGPNYCPPKAAVSDQWGPSRQTNVSEETAVDCAWWANFQDPALDQLIATAKNQNLDLKNAANRIAEARSFLRGSRGNLFPQTQEAFGGAVNTARSINNVTRNNNIQFFDFFETGVLASWELDFWGRYRRAVASSDAELDAAFFNRQDVMVLLLGDVANNYVRLRTAERRLEVANQNIEVQQLTLETATTRFDAGLVSELDVTQAESNLAKTQSSVPPLLIQRQQASNTLCVLMGMPPQSIEPLLVTSVGIPSIQSAINVGVPAELLMRRPDIRRAERKLAAQSERIGIAAAEFYPHLSLTGSIGYSATQFNNLFSADSLTGFVGPTFRWNIFNYGRIVAAMAVEDARFGQLLATYQQTVLTAANEVENGLVAYVQTQHQTESLRQSVASTKRSVALAREQYTTGKGDFDRVFNLEVFQARIEDELAQSEGAIAASLVQTYTALGGGWQDCAQAQLVVANALIDGDEPVIDADVIEQLTDKKLKTPR